MDEGVSGAAGGETGPSCESPSSLGTVASSGSILAVSWKHTIKPHEWGQLDPNGVRHRRRAWEGTVQPDRVVVGGRSGASGGRHRLNKPHSHHIREPEPIGCQLVGSHWVPHPTAPADASRSAPTPPLPLRYARREMPHRADCSRKLYIPLLVLFSGGLPLPGRGTLPGRAS